MRLAPWPFAVTLPVMLEFLNSPHTQAIGAAILTVGLLAVVTGAASMLGTGWLISGRFSREVTPTLSGLAGLVAGLLSMPVWFGAILLVLRVLPGEWHLVAIQSMQWGALLMTFALVVALAMSLPYAREVFNRRKGHVGERLVSKRLTKLGYEHLNDQYVGDDRDVAQVDHIVRVGGLALVLETKNFEGKLYPKPDGSLSLFVSDEKMPSSVPDPSKQVERQVRAVRSLNPGISVRGAVVFGDLAEFPQGLPPGCVRLRDLGAFLRLMLASAPETQEASASWDVLKHALERQDRKHLRSRHVEMLSDNVAFRSLPLGTLVCRACKGQNVVIDHGYSYHWRCTECGHRSQIRKEDDENLVMETDVLYRVGPRGKIIVEGQASLTVAQVEPSAEVAKPFPNPKPKPQMSQRQIITLIHKSGEDAR